MAYLLLWTAFSALTFSDKGSETIVCVLLTNSESCNTWQIENKLSLHIGKMELILFESKRKLIHYTDSLLYWVMTKSLNQNNLWFTLNLNLTNM